MRTFGFSTGSLALGDFKKALEMIQSSKAKAVELSALRAHELGPLVRAAKDLDLSKFDYVSVHAPSKFSMKEEESIIEMLCELSSNNWPIVIHPDAIYSSPKWQKLGSLLLIENMDKRKGKGRTALELDKIFAELPEARLCFDIAHARQFDSTMHEAYKILEKFGDRIDQVHISEVGAYSTHVTISPSAAQDFKEVASMIPLDAPIIIESILSEQELDLAIDIAQESLDPMF